MRGDAAWRARWHAPGHPAMPNACLLGANNLLFQKTLIFLEITPNLWASSSQGQGMLQRPRQPPWACCQGQGMQPGPRQPRPRHAAKAKACSQGPHGHAAKAKACTSHAAKAKAAPMGRLPRPRANSQGQGSPPWASSQGQGTQRRPWHACVGTLACPWGQAARPLGAP